MSRKTSLSRRHRFYRSILRTAWSTTLDSYDARVVRLASKRPTKKAELMKVHFVEVFGHNLESSQTRGFCVDFLNQREGGMVFIRFSYFLLYSVQ